MEISRIEYTHNGTTQRFYLGNKPYGITSMYNTELGYYTFYADKKLTKKEMLSSIISNNINLDTYYFKTN